MLPIVGLDGGRDRGVACVGRGVEKVLPEMQGRDWWGGRIKSFVSYSRRKSKEGV
jgi:hypothetical protein